MLCFFKPLLNDISAILENTMKKNRFGYNTKVSCGLKNRTPVYWGRMPLVGIITELRRDPRQHQEAA